MTNVTTADPHPSTGSELDAARRFGAFAALGGAACMIFGAAFWAASGADLDGALATGTMASYLESAAASQALLVANLTAWIVGVLLLGGAGTSMVGLCTSRRSLAQLALLCYWTAVPLAIASFAAMLALVVHATPEADLQAVSSAEIIGWFASRADWIATVLIIGVGPALISMAGRGDWVPVWLARGGIATAIAGLLTTVAMFTDGLSSYGFLIVPVGLIWTISAGVVLVRLGR